MQVRRHPSRHTSLRVKALAGSGVLVGSMLLCCGPPAHAAPSTCDPDATHPFKIAGQTETAENSNGVEIGTPTSLRARTGERLSPDIRDWDFDGVNPTLFTWYRDGESIAERTGDQPSYTVSRADQGHVLTLAARVEYASGDGTTGTCTAVNSKIIPVNPTSTRVSVTPSIVYGAGTKVRYTVHVRTSDNTAPNGTVQLWYRAVGDDEGDWPGYLFYSRPKHWETRVGSSGIATAVLPANSADGYIFGGQLPVNRLVARYLPADASAEQYSDSSGVRLSVKRFTTQTKLKIIDHHIKSGQRLLARVKVALPHAITSKGTVRLKVSGQTVATQRIAGHGTTVMELRSRPLKSVGTRTVRAYFSPTSGYESFSDAYSGSHSPTRHIQIRH